MIPSVYRVDVAGLNDSHAVPPKRAEDPRHNRRRSLLAWMGFGRPRPVRTGGHRAAAGDDRRTAHPRHRHARALRHSSDRRGGRDALAVEWRWGRRQHPRPRTAPGHGLAGRRRAGAEHQRLLVVRRRARSRAWDRTCAERGAGQVGGGASGSVRGARVGRPAASRPRGRTARGRGEAARASRRTPAAICRPTWDAPRPRASCEPTPIARTGRSRAST